MSTQKVLEKLTAEQEAMIPVWRDKYIDRAFVTHSDQDEDVQYITELVGRSYEAGDVSPPKYGVRFVDSPVALALLCGLINKDAAKAGKFLDNYPVEVPTADLKAVTEGVSGDFNPIIYGNWEGGWLAFYQYFRHVCGIQTEKTLDPIDTLSARIHWWAPFENVAFICRRPISIVREDFPRREDEARRLHNLDGPAVEYRDGEKFYFIAGIEVPAEICETPAEDLNPQLFFQEENVDVRMAIGAKIGLERLYSQMPTTVVDTVTIEQWEPLYHDFQNRSEPLPGWALNDNGELNKDAFCYRLLDIEIRPGLTARYLEMGNPSEDKTHVECVEDTCKTVKEALAFRENLTFDLYTLPEVMS